MSQQATPFHSRFLTLVEQIEGRFPVSQWKCGDVELWPLARMDLYLDMFWVHTGGASPASPASPASQMSSRSPISAVSLEAPTTRATRPWPLRAIGHFATPLTNLWKSRHDLGHYVVRPKPAHAIVLGDGVSLDRIEGAWQDRFAEPVIAALERQGLGAFLMQPGDLSRVPWRRPTYAANRIAVRGAFRSLKAAPPVQLPQHDEVLEFLRDSGVRAPSLSASYLARRGRRVLATASAFEQVLRIVRPAIAFVVTYYAGLGPAFLLACRRQGVLSVDLQHCPQEGAHKAYGWSQLPATGYATLPSVFWNWSAVEAAHIRGWTNGLPLPWHCSVHGGHTQIASFLDDSDADTLAWDKEFDIKSGGVRFEREILVALQPIGGHRATWQSLGVQIAASPPQWRWWIRRHPSSRAHQDVEHGNLLSLDRANVMIEQASSIPLPALLRHMTVVLSLASGSAAEAAAFGVPSLFLSAEAFATFGALIKRGHARVVDPAAVNALVAELPAVPARPAGLDQPDVNQILLILEKWAPRYRELCRSVA